MRAFLACVLTLTGNAFYTVAAAQEPARARIDAVTPVAMASWRADSGKVAEVRLPAIVVSGAPRSYQVVAVSIPDAIIAAQNASVEIVEQNEFSVLGARRRTIDTNARRTRLSITIGIPASAVAGRSVAAEARFTAPGLPTFAIPIEVDVSLIRKIEIRHTLAPVNAQAGNDVILPLDLVNAGNAREQIAMQVVLPSGWASRDLRQSPVEIGPAQTVKKRLRIHIPTLASTGSSFVQVELRSGSDVVGSETLRVEVFNSSSGGGQSGPLLVSSITNATDENGRQNTLLGVTASGSLYDSVRIDARFSHGNPGSGAASNAFSHLGTYQSAASVLLSAPSGSLSLGNTGASFSDLTGLYPYGQGALLQLKNVDWNITSLGAMSMSLPGGKREPMLGVRADRRFGDARLFTSLSHLADGSLLARRLDAVGFGAAVPAPFSTTFKAEIAERRFTGGSGFGWSSELERADAESNEQLRVTHAPGGSDAFARATNEIVANASEKVGTRALLTASAWRTTDASSVFSGLNSNGLSLRPQYALFRTVTLAVDMRSYVFDATSRPTTGNAGGGFGTREQQIGFSLNSYLRQYYFNTSAFLGNVQRSVSPVGQAATIERSPRNFWLTNAGWSGDAGAFEVETRIEQTRDRAGFVNQQSMFGIRGDEVVLPWLGGIRAEGELQRVSGFGDQRSSVIRAGASIPLVNGFALKLDVERNSIYRALGGSVPWVFGARFEHGIMLPMLRAPGTSGYVFQDLNGNQRRDPGEPGVAGAIVRRGSVTAVASDAGKFRVGGDAQQAIVVDEASLPDGWTGGTASKGDVAVTLTTTALLELVVAPRSGFADVEVDLSKTHVIARDSAGKEWEARMTGPSTATFESLPVGSYALEFDLSELTEPLVPRVPLARLIVDGKQSRSLTVTLDPRPVRMWNGSGSKQHDTPKAPEPDTKSPPKPAQRPTV